MPNALGVITHTKKSSEKSRSSRKNSFSQGNFKVVEWHWVPVVNGTYVPVAKRYALGTIIDN